MHHYVMLLANPLELRMCPFFLCHIDSKIATFVSWGALNFSSIRFDCSLPAHRPTERFSSRFEAPA